MLDSTAAGDISAVREHTYELIEDAGDADEPVLIEAPPNSGKTTNAVKLALEAEKPVTYLARRIDLYEQAEEKAEEHDDLRYERVPAPQRDCETFLGENEGSAADIQRLYEKGYSGRTIHLNFRDQAPCGMDCDYIEKMETIDEEIGSIDFLIGHHSHCKRRQYVRDRIVIIDEFNPGPFLQPFPQDDSGVIDNPGDIVPSFLHALDEGDTDFPTNVYNDVTDLIQRRDGPKGWQDAIDWFQEHGASRRVAQDSDLLDPTLEKYDDVHAYAPFLTFSLLCMERIGPGVDLAPPPGGSLDDIWQSADLGPATKCLRDRNTGEMYALSSPDLSEAEQVIGLDGIPTIDLWNLLFAPEDGFDHQQVIDREDFPTYLRSAMNMSLIQIGDGWHPYAAGNVSNLDSDRFAAVQALEEDPFALISTKRALERYRNRGLLDTFVKQTDSEWETDDTRVSENHQALHYATVKSSNDFETESLGVVAGMPHPGDDLVRLWAGLCGEPVEITRSDDVAVEKSFGDLGDKIYQYFAHDQVVQAVLRFGRDQSVFENGGATVYISTYALPDWFDVEAEFNVQSRELEGAVLAKLFEVFQQEDKPGRALRSITKIHELIDEDDQLRDNPSKKGVRNAIERVVEKDYVTVEPNRGKHSADLYRWDGDGEILLAKDGTTLLHVQDDIHVIQMEGEW
jgi:hypothetical protein